MESRQDDTSSTKSWSPKFLNGNKMDEDTPPDERSSLLPKPNGEEHDVYLEDEGSRWHLIFLEFV
jgi:hypothetical protein